MFRSILLLIIGLIFNISLLANGVGIVNAQLKKVLWLKTSEVNVKVENQVALTTTKQNFLNPFGEELEIKYAFPLPENASAVNLKYKIGGIWYQANIAAEPQDSTQPGGGTLNPQLKQYLGETALYFNIDQKLGADSTLIVELTYVQLLKYDFGKVNYSYPNNYLLIQTEPLNEQKFNFNLISERTIESCDMIDIIPTAYSNDGHAAVMEWQNSEASANTNYNAVYGLSLSELGLFGFSTFQPDSIVPDPYVSGFFTFVAEPDPSENTDVIQKVFTLIIDRSGSMGGDKIVQAKNAATFIVDHLNEGDKFNIVDFSGEVTAFRNEHVEFTADNKTAALQYIDNIYAGGSTNISGAFSTAIPQFANTSNQTANIIIFFTDGEATAGITSTSGILSHVADLINSAEVNLSLFTFGIGDYVNEQLLTLLATDNNGISVFLGNDELEEVITNFYLTIRNPVLLNTKVAFSSDEITEIYPGKLPNLYKGQQMIFSGRYSTPGDAQITLSGTAFGKPVEYNYNLNLADSMVLSNQFLPKIWAKQKIEELLIQYYSLDQGSEEAALLKELIIEISMSYGVITEFTSFSGGNPTGIEEEINNRGDEIIPVGFKILGNYPNPFNPSTTISFSVGKDLYKQVVIKIYNSLGQLVRILYISVNGRGQYEIHWDGTLSNGAVAPSGIYIYTVDFGEAILASKMNLMK